MQFTPVKRAHTMSNYPHPPGRSEPDRLLCELVEYLAGAGLADEAPICRQAKRYTDRLRDKEAQLASGKPAARRDR